SAVRLGFFASASSIAFISIGQCIANAVLANESAQATNRLRSFIAPPCRYGLRSLRRSGVWALRLRCSRRLLRSAFLVTPGTHIVAPRRKRGLHRLLLRFASIWGV